MLSETHLRVHLFRSGWIDWRKGLETKKGRRDEHRILFRLFKRFDQTRGTKIFILSPSHVFTPTQTSNYFSKIQVVRIGDFFFFKFDRHFEYDNEIDTRKYYMYMHLIRNSLDKSPFHVEGEVKTLQMCWWNRGQYICIRQCVKAHICGEIDYYPNVYCCCCSCCSSYTYKVFHPFVLPYQPIRVTHTTISMGIQAVFVLRARVTHRIAIHPFPFLPIDVLLEGLQ